MFLLALLLLIPEPYLWSLVEIWSVTGEILLTLSLCGWVVGGGGGGWWIKVIFMSHPTFELSWGWVGVVTIVDYGWTYILTILFTKIQNLLRPNRVCVEGPWLEWWCVVLNFGKNIPTLKTPTTKNANPTILRMLSMVKMPCNDSRQTQWCTIMIQDREHTCTLSAWLTC